LKEITGNPKKLEKTFSCECGKLFVTNSGLWKHTKICSKTNSDVNNVNQTDILTLLLRENNDLEREQTDIKELIK